MVRSAKSSVGDPAIRSDYVYAGPRAKRMTAEQFLDSRLAIDRRGAHEFDAPVIRGRVDDRGDRQARTARDNGSGATRRPTMKPRAAGEQLVFRKSHHSAREAVVAGAAVITADNAFELYVGRARSPRRGLDPTANDRHGGTVDQEAITRSSWSPRISAIGPIAAGLYFEARLRLGGRIASSRSPRTIPGKYSDQVRQGRPRRSTGKNAGTVAKTRHTDWGVRGSMAGSTAAKRGLAMGLAGKHRWCGPRC